MRSLLIAATGMLAQQRNVETISNNISNSSTTGYKKQRAEFEDLLYQNYRRIGSSSSDAGTIVPTGVQLGAGVRLTSVARITTQGDLSVTDNELDLAINGHGYFQVQLPTGDTAYTRAGNFKLSSTGQIVTDDGYTVLPAITIPTDASGISIDKSGQVSVTIDGQSNTTTVGQLQIANFANASGLEATGDNLFLETAASGAPVVATPGSVGYGSIEQGSLESSNVDTVEEMTTLITAQRAYEMNSKVIKTTDEMLQTSANMRS